MAKREFNLPGIQDLSKEQEDARALPKQGQHLIIGGPGTGKSVVALLRSRRHHQDKDDYVFLVYNKLLHQASCQLFGEELRSQQWQSWFMKTFRAATGDAVPMHSKDEQGWQNIDWAQASTIISTLPHHEEAKLPFLIIDEGQDMPPDFYQALANLGFENFYVVADGNQQIAPGKGSLPIPEIAGLLGYECRPADDPQNSIWVKTNADGTVEQLIDLLTNYRNSYPIARLAQEFFTYSTSRLPELPNRPSRIRPLLIEYIEGKFQKIIERILKNADMHPNKLYGVITPDNKVREKYYQALITAKVKLDNGQPRIETYANNMGDNPNISFNEGGIMVINAQSCKGLEFDTLFLADIDQYHCNTRNQETVKRLFYVMVARAREQVVMLKKAGITCAVEAILPQDTEIMERKNAS